MLRGIAAVMFGMALQFALARLPLPDWAAAVLGVAEPPAAVQVTNNPTPVRQAGDGEGPLAFGVVDCGPLDGALIFLDPDVLLKAAAETLGMSPEDLRAELRTGHTLGELADEQGVSRERLAADLEDAALADYQARLDEAVADGRLEQDEADDRLQKLAEKDFSKWLDLPFFMIPPLVDLHPWPFGSDELPFDGNVPFIFPGGGASGLNFSFRFSVNGETFTYEFNSYSPAFRAAAAGALGLTEEELADRLDGGESLAEIAKAEGVDGAALEAALRAAMLVDAQAKLDEAVAAGELTQDQADKIMDQIEGGMRVRLFAPGRPGELFPIPAWSEQES